MPEIQRLSAMKCALRDKSLRYFTETTRRTVFSVDDSFHKLEERIVTLPKMDTKTIKWNRLELSVIKVKYSQTYIPSPRSTVQTCKGHPVFAG